MSKFPLALVLTMQLVSAIGLVAQQPALQRPPQQQRALASPEDYVPDLSEMAAATSELRDVVDRFEADRRALQRFHNVPGSSERRAKTRSFYEAWLAALPRLDFDALSQQGRVDYVLLRNQLEYQLMLLGREERNARETDALVPFAESIIRLQEDRQKLNFIRADSAVTELQRIRAAVERARDSRAAAGATGVTPLIAVRAAQRVDELRNTLRQWFGFYDGYDPAITSLAGDTQRAADRALSDYATLLRTRIAGLAPPVAGASASGDDAIVGDPIGREGLVEDLAGEMIVYTPEELIEIGNREYAWAEAEMIRAARELGFGDDWMRALEHVKNQYVPRGEQPALIRDLALEAETWLAQNDLITVPPLASDIWRMQMMTPERQRVNPFFTGGETISVSYPTDSMSESDAMMSMRGNGIHVSRATVHHELIPGHHLQGFMNERYNSHRALFGTPFAREGWALYWELLMWDMNFPRSPEDRIGMLWWRMHRAARIIFSLNFHLGRWTPEQCIDFLVERVGHERFTATGEVRRSFQGNYSPLYQVAYMMGGLQLRSLNRELVGSGRMTAKQFHDSVMRAGAMPVEMLRALLSNQTLARDYTARWRYYEVPAAGSR
jgi:uncharacterized protein (DUF885 family)